MKRTLIFGCIGTAFLLLMVPTLSAIQGTPVRGILDFQSQGKLPTVGIDTLKTGVYDSTNEKQTYEGVPLVVLLLVVLGFMFYKPAEAIHQYLGVEGPVYNILMYFAAWCFMLVFKILGQGGSIP